MERSSGFVVDDLHACPTTATLPRSIRLVRIACTRTISKRVAGSVSSLCRAIAPAIRCGNGRRRSSGAESRCTNAPMSRKCPSCGSHVVVPSHFRGHAERTRYPSRSPYRCLACGARFFVISHTTRQALIGLLVAIPIAFAVVVWLTPAAITKRPQLPNSPEFPNSPTSSEAKAATLAEMARESRCTSEPVNVTGETYKCATRSGLTAYFVVPSSDPSGQTSIPSQESAAGRFERSGAPQH